MRGAPKVLAVTKRTADLCATQAHLYRAGFELIASTNIALAKSMVGALNIKAVILCYHSWTDEERAAIVADINANHPDVKVIVHCPGCKGHGDHHPGTLSSFVFVDQMIFETGNGDS
jgi:hypothetical protein